MFNPISLSVIRQSLAWSNLTPLHIHRLLHKEHDNGDQTALYDVTFDEGEILALWLWESTDSLETPRDTLAIVLRSAFCDDVRIGATWRDDERHEYHSQIFVTVKARDTMLDGELAWLID